MIGFKTILKKFGSQGEKTGWTYIVIPEKIASKIKPANKRGFRVKGRIDDHKIQSVAILPRGDGDFILPVNAAMRKALLKRKGDSVLVELELDNAPQELSGSLLSCLEDEPEGKSFYSMLPPSHQQYYSKWIESAKTEPTKTKRIATVLHALSNKLTYSQMMQFYRQER